MKTINLQPFGRLMIILGVLGFIASVIQSFTIYAGLDRGALPASSFLFVLLGMVFHFPELLKEGEAGKLSTMRLVTFSITVLFVVIYFKIGWTSGTFEDFWIDSTWIYILGLAFGSKALQKMSEKKEKGSANDTENTDQ